MTEAPWYSLNRIDGAAIGVIDRFELSHSIYTQVTSHLRDGIEAHVLDGLSVIRSMESVVAIDREAVRRQRLEEELPALRRRASAARRLAAEEAALADADPDAELNAQEYREDARRVTRQLRSIERELDQLSRPPTRTTLADEFTCDVDLMIKALSCLLTDDGLVTRAESIALAEVIDGFEIKEPLNIREDYEWTLFLRILADDHVIRLGPISGTVPRRGRRPTPGELGRILHGDDYTYLHTREKLRSKLRRAGCGEKLVAPVAHCPLPEVIEAILDQHPTWGDSNSARFDPATFNAHLRDVYTSDMMWRPHIYAVTNPNRQTLTDLVAALGGSARADQMFEAFRQLELNYHEVRRLSQVQHFKPTPPWEPSVTRTGPWNGRKAVDAPRKLMHSVRCPSCGDPATACIRVPEVPGSLLCRRCHIPPKQPDLIFPASYISLALPTTEFDAQFLTGLRDRYLTPQPEERHD